jgi:hypothetical protein
MTVCTRFPVKTTHRQSRTVQADSSPPPPPPPCSPGSFRPLGLCSCSLTHDSLSVQDSQVRQSTDGQEQSKTDGPMLPSLRPSLVSISVVWPMTVCTRFPGKTIHRQSRTVQADSPPPPCSLVFQPSLVSIPVFGP